MKNLLLTLALLMGLPAATKAQNVPSIKLSPSTLLAIEERDGKLQLPQARRIRAQWQLLAEEEEEDRRPIAEPVTINGRDMISCILHVRDGQQTAGAEALGAQVGSRFSRFVTALVPTDQLEAIAALDEVRQVEVATPVDPCTDVSRVKTNAYDVLNLSSAAQQAGLTQQYRGTGVVAGIIDQGIQFDHSAFKNGSTSRIAWAWVNKVDAGTMTECTTAEAISGLTYDYNGTLHGTHTLGILGGSDYTYSGSTYGGMAPDATLAVVGLGNSCYTNANIIEGMQRIKAYAQSVGKPCVISISIASHENTHDGTSPMSQAIKEVAGEGCIVVMATGNYAGRARTSRVSSGLCLGGGLYSTGTATSSKPWMGIVEDYNSSYAAYDDKYYIYKNRVYAYARTPNVPISVQLHVINVSTGSVVWSSSAYTSGSSTITSVGTTSGRTTTTYYTLSSSNLYKDSKAIRVTVSQDATTGKYYAIVYCPGMTAGATTTSGSYKKSSYAFAISVKPTSSSASTTIDAWCTYSSKDGHFGSLSKSPSGYNVCVGSDASSASEYCNVEECITVGNYVTRQSVTAGGSTHTYDNGVGELAYTSCWQAEGAGPSGIAMPTVCAPGTYIISSINKNYSSYTSSQTNNDSSNPYGYSNGTSMACPHVAGIIALWLQADPTLTPARVKEVIAATAQTDSYTSAKPAAFGAGKIDALAGLKYILDQQQEEELEGDLDGDGDLDLADLQMLVDYIIGVEGAEKHDLTGDGEVTLADITTWVNLYKKYLNQKGK